MSDAVSAWDYPILLGNRLCWFDGEHNRVVPVVDVRPIYTDDRKLDPMVYGYHADLPTENGATVTVAYDPHFHSEDESPVTQWLYVRHPQFDTLVAANVEDGTIVYDPRCSGTACEYCYLHGVGHWWEYVTSAEQVLRNLAWLGSLPIKVPERLMRFVGSHNE